MRPIDGDHLRLTLLGWREAVAELNNNGALVMINLFLDVLDHEPTIKEGRKNGATEKTE